MFNKKHRFIKNKNKKHMTKSFYMINYSNERKRKITSFMINHK